MSLAELRKIDEDGVTFRSHLDGSRHLLTPERSIEIQHLLGADITMAFDECTPFPAEREAVEASMELSMRWAERSRARLRAARPGHGIFGIVQGGVHPDLRAALGGARCRDRLRRLRGRRARGRRGPGDDVRGARRDRAGCCRRTGRAT